MGLRPPRVRAICVTVSIKQARGDDAGASGAGEQKTARVRDVPTARQNAEVLARRLARAIDTDARAPEAVLEDAAHPAAPALHALGALARRLRARTVDAVLTPEALVVSMGTDGVVPLDGRVFDLSRTAFERPLRLQSGRTLSLDSPSGSSPALVAAAGVARAQLARMRSMESEVLRDEDPEGAHELRVAARRARCAVRLLAFAEPEAQEHYRALHEPIRAAALLAGAVRDHDVFLEALKKNDALSAGVRDAAQRALRRSRRKHFTRLARALEGADHSAALIQCDAALARAGASEREPTVGADGQSLESRGAEARALDDLARAFTERQLRRLRKRLEADLTHPEGLHDVRRAMRRVRDVIELFGPSLREGQRSLRKRMQPVQSLLGSLNDMYVAEALLTPHRAESWSSDVYAWIRARRASLEVQLAIPLAVLAATAVVRW